jgi:hypothetical protein
MVYVIRYIGYRVYGMGVRIKDSCLRIYGLG